MCGYHRVLALVIQKRNIRVCMCKLQICVYVQITNVLSKYLHLSTDPRLPFTFTNNEVVQADIFYSARHDRALLKLFVLFYFQSTYHSGESGTHKNRIGINGEGGHWREGRVGGWLAQEYEHIGVEEGPHGSNEKVEANSRLPFGSLNK